MSRRAFRIALANVEPFWHYVPEGDAWFRQTRTRRVRVRDRDDTSATVVFLARGLGSAAVELCDSCVAGQTHSRGYHAHALRRFAMEQPVHSHQEPSYSVTLSGWATSSTQLTSPVAGSYSAIPAVKRWRTTSRPSGARAGYSSETAGPRVSPRR